MLVIHIKITFIIRNSYLCMIDLDSFLPVLLASLQPSFLPCLQKLCLRFPTILFFPLLFLLVVGALLCLLI